MIYGNSFYLSQKFERRKQKFFNSNIHFAAPLTAVRGGSTTRPRSRPPPPKLRPWVICTSFELSLALARCFPSPTT
jgi:hypothetical protein